MADEKEIKSTLKTNNCTAQLVDEKGWLAWSKEHDKYWIKKHEGEGQLREKIKNRIRGRYIRVDKNDKTICYRADVVEISELEEWIQDL